MVSLLPAGVFATPVAQQGNFKVSVAGTAPGSIPHDIALKVTQIPGGQLSEATGFAISPESVVQVKQGENIIVTTSENLKVNNVKAKNVQGQQVDLTPLPNNLWSLQNLVPGVYLLDVIVDMSSSGILGVYETVLVILQPDQTPLPPSTVINQLSIIIENGPPEPPTPCPPEVQVNGVCPPSPEPPTPCPPDAPENEVCPPTDEITPVPEPPCPPETMENGVCPPTDEITPVPEPPPPDCPEAGPEACGEEPPPEEVPPDSDDGTNGNGNDNGNGADGSSGNGNGDNQGGSNDNNGDSSDGGLFFD